MDRKRKLVFVNTHPVQYYAPLYKQIHEDAFFDLEVWYCTKHGLEGEFDKEFNASVKWDTPVLEGYSYKFLKNISWNPGIYSGFFGIVNPGIFSQLRKLPKRSIVVANAWNPFSTMYTIICSNLLGHVTCLRAEPPLVHEFQKSKAKLLLRKILLKQFLFNIIDVFLYIGTQNKKFYEFYGVASSKLYPSPYSVNNRFFSEKASELLHKKPALKQALNIFAENAVLLFSGKLIPKKRPIDLLLAFERIATKFKATLIYMGEGELRSELETLIKIKNTPNVIITGFINQSKISDYYAIADVFVMCSDIGETWGLSTNEAMNFGVPVVISDKTGNFEDLVNGNGYIFKTGNVDDLSEKLETLLSESDQDLKKKGEKSKEIIKNFSYEVIIENLKKIK